jgi:vancomycin resistance protein YoaR
MSTPMPDLPDSGTDRTDNASIDDDEIPAGDPELAALVQRVSDTADPPTAEAPTDASADAPASGEPTDTTTEDTSPTSEPGVDTEPVVPLAPVAAIVTDGEPTTRPRRRRSFALRFGVSFVLGFVLAVSVGAGVLYAWGQQYDGRVLPGVQVGNTEVGGLTREQAESAISNAYGSLTTGQITLSGPDGRDTTISYADVGRGPDTAALADAALAAGRHGEPLVNLISEPHAALQGVTLDPAVTYDRERLTAAVRSLASTIDHTATVAFVTTGTGGSFNVTPAKDGRVVDKAALLAALDQQLLALDAPASITVDIPVIALTPAVATASAEAAKAAADRMVADIVVARGDDDWKIARKSLAPLISFSTAADGTMSPVFHDEGLDPIVAKLAKEVNQKVKNASLKLVGGHVVATGTSREGRTLDLAGMKAGLMSAIGAREAGLEARPVAAVVDAVDPKLTTADAAAFAPKMKMISSYSVFYWVLINNHWGGNIEAPATKINGTVVPAGAKFDFWKVVGDLRKLPGTGPGNAIEGGKITVTGAFGGGICTTSTTLFNAAFRAGMIPLARQNHNEYITRYPPGLDATVWIVGNTKQTMSFRNDTEYPILITRTVTQSGNKRWLTFKIWSVPNGRKATVTNTVIKHGPKAKATTVNDPSKPVGYRYFNNAPADGAKVWTTVTIYDHGKLHWQKRYFSNYPAVDGVTIVGTKKTT